MPSPDYEKVQTSDETLNRIQDNVQQFTDQRSEIGRGNCLEDVSFAAGSLDQEVPHNLERRFLGATCIKCDTAGVGYQVRDSQVDNERFVRITASGASTASFWVF